jgi:uncharacterized protein involved in exopolysaccharide biosynthesis
VSDIERESELGSYSALLRRRGVWLITIIPSIVLLSVFLAYALPAQYRSTATLMLEQGSISEDIVKSTVRSYADQQIDVIQGRVLTLDAMRELVRRNDPYPEQTDLDVGGKAQRIIKDTSLERVDPVTFEPRDQSTAVSLHYQNPSPQRASVIASELADLFLSYHQRARVDSAHAAVRLIENRASSLTKDLQGIDEEYARLRLAFGGTLPNERGNAEDVRYRAERDLDEQERQLRVAQERESLLRIQLGSTSPNLLVNKGDLTDLATVKAQLADAQLRYTPDHPDVKRLQRALALLLAQQGPQTGGAPAANADNPEYRRLAGELAAAHTEVSALQAANARSRDMLAHYTANVNPPPVLERQLADLDRRRASLQSQYQEVQEKLKNAQLGTLAEAGEHSEHFSLLQAPFPASTPYSPNRIGVILLGLVLACALAAAAVAIAESADVTVRGARDFIGLRGLPILGTVPEILLDSDRRRRRLVWGSVAAAYVLFIGIDAAVIAQATLRAQRAVIVTAPATTVQLP